ncbi:hypothetical protein [Methylotenera sp. G11]|uniref:hypothetical protein n=1 Tax=Methylotenera sp. G11 TaxID=1506585 RepID=UPI000A6DA581|nr:hypothetical protein [Methylotenera sp. G11]
MQFTIKKLFSFAMAVCIFATVSIANAAPPKKTYTEDEFLNTFSGKTKKVITEKLGEPFKKELSVKPSGANTMLLKAGADESKSKPVKVEMWYYKNIVKYDPKRTYKETEVTLVNDRVMNIAFFNNR